MTKLADNTAIISVFVTIAQIPYFFLKLLPTMNKIVLISRNHLTTSIDFALLRDEIKRRNPQTKVVILNHYMRSRLSHVLDILVEMYHLATSRACVVDSYVIAVSILHHKRQLIIVQIWHALGAIKQFGYMTLNKKAGHSASLARAMHMHRNYTYITCGSRATIPIYQTAFDADPDIILPIGAPRIDYLMNKRQMELNRQKLIRKYPQLADGRKVILYLPTFRRKRKTKVAEMLRAIDYSKYVVVFKKHRLDKTDLSSHNSHNVVIIDNQVGSLELMSVADCVITDYSGAVFEAALLNKPMFFYDYDYQQYATECGFAVDYKHEMPGFISSDANKIMRAIASRKFSAKRIKSFAQKWVAVRDGSCTRRIVDLLEVGS